jgi:hypothetical protein
VALGDEGSDSDDDDHRAESDLSDCAPTHKIPQVLSHAALHYGRERSMASSKSIAFC